MENAKVWLVEDSEAVRQVLRIRLGVSSHSIVAEDDTLQGALEFIEGAQEGDIDVAVVDGNLDGPLKEGQDGELIASALKHAFDKNVVVIGISATHELPSADINIDKVKDIANIAFIIDALPDTRG